MQSTNGHGPQKQAVLYARVSTDEQARSGYSLAQQMEALRTYTTREGYEVLEEVADPGQSGATLERPGMDRVRNLVAAGGVSVVLAQDRDRFAREPAYHYLLRKEFEEQGTKLRALNDRGDESPEGELTDGILDQLAKYERAKTAERSRRGKLRKAREGKLLRNSRPRYGFKFDETGEGYVVDEREMILVRRIFRAVAGGSSLRGVKRSLGLDGVPPPGNAATTGSRYWNAPFLRAVIRNDAYRPHTHTDIEALVSEGLLTPEVAARLDESASYGIAWYNRTRVTHQRVSKAGSAGKEYCWRKVTRPNPRDQWIAVPVPDAGIPLEVVEAARQMIEYNESPPKANRRFWELPGGAVRCGGCGNRMLKYAGLANGKVYAYYKCTRLIYNGKDACSPERLRTNHRAEEVERRVWEGISALMKDPEELRADLEKMIELKKNEISHGDPEREAKTWAEKLAECARLRSAYQDQQAAGLMTLEELSEKLEKLDETRKTVKRELRALENQQESIEELERDQEALLEHYAGIAPEALDSLTPEERHQLYKLTRLQVVIQPNCDLEVRWVGELSLSLSKTERVQR